MKEVLVDDLEETDTWFESNSDEIHLFTDPNPGSVGILDDNIDNNPANAQCETTKCWLGNQKIRAQFGH